MESHLSSTLVCRKVSLQSPQEHKTWTSGKRQKLCLVGRIQKPAREVKTGISAGWWWCNVFMVKIKILFSAIFYCFFGMRRRGLCRASINTVT